MPVTSIFNGIKSSLRSLRNLISHKKYNRNVTTSDKNDEIKNGQDAGNSKADIERKHKNYSETKPEKTANVNADTEMKEGSGETMPDVLLDVPNVNADEIKLLVEDLNAHVALQAELADLVKINVGVYAGIKKLDLDVKGLNVQAVLKVKLKNVHEILSRALNTIDNNPEIFKKSNTQIEKSKKDIENEQKKSAEKNKSPELTPVEEKKIGENVNIAEAKESKINVTTNKTKDNNNILLQQDSEINVIKETDRKASNFIEGKYDVIEKILQHRFSQNK